MEKHFCNAHGEPVEMEKRDMKHSTPEQKFCGTWYDCPKCSNATLIPSESLERQLSV